MGQFADRLPLAGRTIGFIGLGRMGQAMARRLSEAGANLVLWNRTIEKAERLASGLTRAAPVPSPRHVAEAAEMVVLMVSDAEAVQAVVFDPEDDRWGVVHGLDEDRVVIDMGSTPPSATRDFAGRLRMVGGRWVDAPASGGPAEAGQGALSIVVGGSDADVITAEPVLSVLGNRTVHVGALGCGQAASIANRVAVGLTIGAVAEAFALATKAGVEPSKLREAMLEGPAHSRVLDRHGARMASNDFRVHDTTGGHADIRAAAAFADELGIELPGLTANAALWDRLIALGYGDLDPAALLLAVQPVDNT